MRYLVVTQTGLFGPADLDQLANWASEGRLLPSTMLEEEGTGKRVAASSVVGISFPAFGQTANAPANAQKAPPSPMQPIPPQMLSTYRRPGYEPPLFLASELDGRRELLYSFLLAIAAPAIALVHIYGIAMAIGGIYCAVVALQRGRRLGIFSLILNIVAVPAALFLHFGGYWLF